MPGPELVLALVYVIAAWAIITGALEIAAAVRFRHHVSHEWLLVLGGIVSLVFGFLLMIAPFAGALVRYGMLLRTGDGEAPDELVLRDRPLALLSVCWLVLFALSVHAAG